MELEPDFSFPKRSTNGMALLSEYVAAHLGLKVVNEGSQMLHEEGPRVDQKHSVHHHHNETVPVQWVQV